MRRRALIALLGAILLLVAIVCLVPAGGPQYVARSRVVVMPYTNAIFASSFAAGVVQQSPGVLRLRMFPTLSPAPGAGSASFTNGVGIDIMVRGRTSLEAQQLANEAATSLCATARQTFGGNAVVVDMADRARPYSTLHDSFMPNLGRLFTW